MTSIEFNSSTRSIKDLVTSRKCERIKVPEHQRNSTVWNDKNRKKFIDSCKKGLPFPTILIYQDETGIGWLEDGLQRLTTLSDFMDNKFTDEQGLKFSEWPEVTQRLFEKYTAPTLTYSGATDLERVEIFDRFQNGSPLKVGERLHSLGYTPLVSFTKRMLMKYKTEDGGEASGEFFDRAQRVWGPIKLGDADKRHDELCKFVALMNGVVHGCHIAGGGISKKYEDLREQILVPIDDEMQSNARKVLTELFSIYEDADARKPVQGRKHLKVQKDIGNFNGAIVYSLKEYPDEWDRIHAGWVEFLISYRENNDLLKEKILNHVSGARSWNRSRWETTYRHVFDLTDSSDESVTTAETNDDEEEDE